MESCEFQLEHSIFKDPYAKSRKKVPKNRDQQEIASLHAGGGDAV